MSNLSAGNLFSMVRTIENYNYARYTAKHNYEVKKLGLSPPEGLKKEMEGWRLSWQKYEELAPLWAKLETYVCSDKSQKSFDKLKQMIIDELMLLVDAKMAVGLTDEWLAAKRTEIDALLKIENDTIAAADARVRILDAEKQELRTKEDEINHQKMLSVAIEHHKKKPRLA
jgi:hypothetical protein